MNDTRPYFFECEDCRQGFVVPELPEDAEPPIYCEECKQEIAESGQQRQGEGRGVLESIAQTWSRDGYIYIIGGGGYFKIGRATNVNKRLSVLKIQLPWRVHLIHTIPCTNHRASEKALHRMFADRRANGEWFRLENHDLESLLRIARMDGPRIEHIVDIRRDGAQ